jgi:hypothetical protein
MQTDNKISFRSVPYFNLIRTVFVFTEKTEHAWRKREGILWKRELKHFSIFLFVFLESHLSRANGIDNI